MVSSPINNPLSIKQPTSPLSNKGYNYTQEILKKHQEYLLSKDPHITTPFDLKDLELMQRE